jgi:ParB family transcriptional regulator, chromosome partitioning protein
MMADEGTKNRLGRGLAALLGEAAETSDFPGSANQKKVGIELVRPNPANPRRHFDDAQLAELADSIREKGVLQPIIVRNRPDPPGTFEIIAGERRWRAAQRAGLHDVPVIIVSANDNEALELAIVENVQRSDLNAIEEARGYDRLMSQFGYTQVEVSKVVGKSRSHVANTLRLMNLPDSVKSRLEEGALSAGHARALLALDDPERAAQRIVDQGLTVRDVERLSQKSDSAPERKALPIKDADTRALEKALSDVLGLSVDIAHKPQGGTISIRYKTLEQLEDVCLRLQR